MRTFLPEPAVRTPIAVIDTGVIRARAKLEQFNVTRSHKDRAARFLIETMLCTGAIGAGTELVLSTSGNFGKAIAHYASQLGIAVQIVTDVLSSPSLIDELRDYSNARVMVINEPDSTGSHIKARFRLIDQILEENRKSVFVDQYSNFLIPIAYEASLAREIDEQTKGSMQALILPVGTGGMLNGILKYKNHSGARWPVIAVDAQGSALFHVPPPRIKRRLPGYGNGLRSGLVRQLPAGLDAVVHVSDNDVVSACHFLANNGLSVGPSSGATVVALNYIAIHRPELLEGHGLPVAIFPDSGIAYSDTVYNANWLASKGLSQAGG
jgi:cysteine synthase